MAPIVDGSTASAVLVPMKIDAFVLNEAVCKGQSRIAPITQPDFSHLDPEDAQPKDNILPYHDLTYSAPPSINSRLTDLTTGESRKDRFGIYLSWCLPRPFRSGFAATESAKARVSEERAAKGLRPAREITTAAQHAMPEFIPVPNRWIVVRQLAHLDSQPVNGRSEHTACEVFIVESDRVRDITEFALDADVEIEATPFLDPTLPLAQQGEAFIGWATRNLPSYEQYKTEHRSRTDGHHVPLTVMSTSNIYLPDYQPHHGGVFSVHDDLSDLKTSDQAQVSYFVMGFYAGSAASDDTDDPLAHYGEGGSMIDGTELLNSFGLVPKRNYHAETHVQELATLGQWKRNAAQSGVITVCHGALYNVEWDSGKAPAPWPTEDFAKSLLAGHPVAVGATAMDGLVAYARAVEETLDDADEKSAASFLLRRLQGFMFKPADDVDAQFEAADLLETVNFVPSHAGTTWHLGRTAEDKAHPVPSPDQARALVIANDCQRTLDQKMREAQHLQHLLFCEWWKFFSARDVTGAIDAGLERNLAAQVKDIVERLTAYNDSKNPHSLVRLREAVKRQTDQQPFERGTGQTFSTQKDPVVSFAGMQNGWPDGWHEIVPVRIKDLGKSNYIFDDVDEQFVIDQIDNYSKVCGEWFSERYLSSLGYSDMPASENLKAEIHKVAASIKSTKSCIVNDSWELNHDLANSVQKLSDMFSGWLRTLARFTIDGMWFNGIGGNMTEEHKDQFWASFNSLRAAQSRCKILDVLLEDGGRWWTAGFRGGNFDGKWRDTDSPLGGFLRDSEKEQLFDRYQLEPDDYLKRLKLFEDGDFRGKLQMATKFDARREIPLLFHDLFLEWIFGHGMEELGRNVSQYANVHDRWQGQAWFPLFVEWDAEYYNIPFQHWQFAPSGNEKIVRWTIKPETDVSSIDKDITRMHGRSHILPEIGRQLQRMLKRLFETVRPSQLDEMLPERAQAELESMLKHLPFMSATMQGFSDHMVTLQSGNHVKPLFRSSETGLHEVKPGARPSSAERIGFTETVLHLMGSQTGRTPSGTSDSFKPVTHGQLRFTKLNIIDKFGQVICCLDPGHPSEHKTPTPLYPCVSEYLSCNPIDPSVEKPVANTVLREEPGHCQFVQFPPRINQPARWNAHFVRPSSNTSPVTEWATTQEWENPMWGIIVVNYIDRSLQVFSGDGDFVAEYAIGGQGGAGAGVRYRPLKPTPPKDVQLKALVDKFGDLSYLTAIYDMLANALCILPHAPNQYADAMPAVVGKPIALVNMAWSLELATEALHSQSNPGGMSQPAADLLSDYDIPLKLGDKDVSYDGLVGYCGSLSNTDAGLDLFHIQTDFRHDHYGVTPEPTRTDDPEVLDSKILKDIEYPSFKPYFVSTEGLTPSELATHHREKLKVFGAFVDPFTPVHGYSGILPLRQLALPPWVVNDAIARMTGFFAMGPILVPDDVRPVHIDPNVIMPPAVPVEGGSVVQPAQDPTAASRTIQIPAPPAASSSQRWEWLQPSYQADDHAAPIVGGVGVDGKTFYEAMKIGFVDRDIGLRQGPLSAVEGYLKLHKEGAAETA